MNKKTWIEIINDGEMDIEGLHLMGISTKRDDNSKIGMFGSGNKYTIAVLLEKKIPFKIFSGEKKINITTKPVMFRGQLFEQIFINNKKTSLTTSMGKDWESWFCIRELYCNALDEGGAKIGITQSLSGEKNKTKVFVEMIDDFQKMFKNINKYILTTNDSLIETSKTYKGQVEIHQAQKDEFICYRKGIRIMPENKISSLYWYNFDEIQINESRTYQYEYELKERIASALAVSNNRDIIFNYLSNWKGKYEEGAHWEYVNNKMSDMWHSILVGKRVYPENLAIDSGDFEGKRNSFIVPNSLAKLISKNFSDVEVVGSKKDKQYVVLETTSEEQQKLDRAVKDLKAIGYNITSKIKLAKAMTNDVIAWYDKEENTIYHTRTHLNGLKELKNTLLEEHLHSIGHEDGQRAFVTFLIDEVIKSKESLLLT